MPFPVDLEALEAAGYVYDRSGKCSECGEDVEYFKTPAKREIVMDPMGTPGRAAIQHWNTCKPRPQTKDALIAAGHVFYQRNECAKCKKAIDWYRDSGGVLTAYDPMMGGDWKAVVHGCIGAISHSVEEPSEEAGGSEPTPESQQGQEGGNAGQEIKLYGVNDPNHQLIAVGYEPVGGILVCQWAKGKGQHLEVPEALYLELRRVPFAYKTYQQKLKGKFTDQKLT